MVRAKNFCAVTSALLILVLSGCLAGEKAAPQTNLQAIDVFLSGRFNWKVSEPLVAPLQRADDTTYSVKDPTIVYYDGRWHLFCTVRAEKRSHQIEYISFESWKNVHKAQRSLLTVTEGYFCAPQVFYFEPDKKWYLIYQTSDKSRKPALQPAYSTTDDISKPDSWSKPMLLFDRHPDNVKMWIDFWVICDDIKAHLFFTSLDGKMWRAETELENFPAGWSRPSVVLDDDIFEAGHTYHVKDTDRFLTVVEAQNQGRRYYKAYIADRLDGQWSPLAATEAKPFASPVNTNCSGACWADSFSHGELIRDGFDQKLQIDCTNMGFLFQGVSDKDKEGKKYGRIPWRLGILRP